MSVKTIGQNHAVKNRSSPKTTGNRKGSSGHENARISTARPLAVPLFAISPGLVVDSLFSDSTSNAPANQSHRALLVFTDVARNEL